MITMSEQTQLRTEMATTIMDRVEDPALWLLAARRIVVALGLRAERCIKLGVSLEIVTAEILNEAAKHGNRFDAQSVRAALAAI